jgi:ArsR family transcriptional regulator
VNIEQALQCLNNSTRLRCLQLLAQSEEVCVCEFVDTLGISQPTASKALAALKNAGFLSGRRDANWTYYRLSAHMPPWQHDLLNATIAGLRATSTASAAEK